jgi:cytochrome c-type biogenesis protein CcmF
MSILVVCFWGVISPLMSELITGSKITVGPPFYERATGPLFAILMLLMAVAPLSAWGLSSAENMGRVNRPILGGLLALPIILFGIFFKPLESSLGSMVNTVIVLGVILVILGFLYMFRRAIWQAAAVASLVVIVAALTYTQNIVGLIGFFLVALTLVATLREFWRAARARHSAHGENLWMAMRHLVSRNSRRYGGYVIHISMMLMAIGILGIELFQVETQGTEPVNGKLSVGGYTAQYDSIANFPGPDQRQVTRAVVSLYKNGAYIGQVFPRIDYYPDAQQTMTIPGQRSTLKDDVYILLVDWQPASSVGATFKIFINPLVNWLWIGSVLFLIGVIIAAWPHRELEPSTVSATRQVYQAHSAD